MSGESQAKNQQARQLRQQIAFAFARPAALGWSVGMIVLWFAGLAGSDLGSFVTFLLTGLFVCFLLVAIVAYYTIAAVDEPMRVRFAQVATVLALLAGAALAFLFRGFAY